MPPPSFWTVMRPAMIWPSVLLVFGALFLLISLGDRDLTADLAARGVVTQAQVLARERIPPRTRDGRETYRLHLVFDTPTGRVERDSAVSRAGFEATGGMAGGAQVVQVIYLPDTPDRFRLLRLHEQATADGALDPRLLGAAPLVVALALMGRAMFARLPLWRAVTGGDRYDVRPTVEIRQHRGQWARLRWTGRDGKAYETPARRADRMPAAGTMIEVAIDPETGREFWMAGS